MWNTFWYVIHIYKLHLRVTWNCVVGVVARSIHVKRLLNWCQFSWGKIEFFHNSMNNFHWRCSSHHSHDRLSLLLNISRRKWTLANNRAFFRETIASKGRERESEEERRDREREREKQISSNTSWKYTMWAQDEDLQFGLNTPYLLIEEETTQENTFWCLNYFWASLILAIPQLYGNLTLSLSLCLINIVYL